MSNPPQTQPALSTHLWLVFYKAFHALRKHDLNSISATGLGLSDFGVLEVLFHKGPLPIQVIGEKVLLTSGSMTATIDRLTEKKLVRRESDPKDGRIRIIHLTDEGHQLISQAFEQHQQTLARAMAGITDEEQQILIGLLKKLGQYAQTLL